MIASIGIPLVLTSDADRELIDIPAGVVKTRMRLRGPGAALVILKYADGRIEQWVLAAIGDDKMAPRFRVQANGPWKVNVPRKSKGQA